MTPSTRPSGPAVEDAPGSMVTLRLVQVEDAARLAELEASNREELLVGAPIRPDEWFTEEGQRRAISRSLQEAEAGRSLAMVIVVDGGDGEGERVVGRLSLSGVVRGAFQSASLGYWVDKEETGRGVATRAVRSGIGIAFQLIGLHRLQAEVQVGNDASARVLEKSGFAEYGRAPDYLHLGGRWTDCRLFQLVDPSWMPAGNAVEAEPAGDPEAESTGDAEAEPAGDDLAEPADPVPERASEAEALEITIGRPDLEEAVRLYDAVGWTVYTNTPSTLDRALDASAHVVVARRGGVLRGLARVVTDGSMIVLVQDILIDPSEQGAGLGRRLVDAVLEPYDDVRTTLLLTDAEPGLRAFYEAVGFTETHDHPAGLRAFVRLR